MRIRIVDAFTDRPFSGNPAGVLLLDAFPDDAWLQQVANEVNHAETAFAHPLPRGRRRRLGAALVHARPPRSTCAATPRWPPRTSCPTTGAHEGPVRFATRSGVLIATARDGRLDHPRLPDRAAHPGRRPGRRRRGPGRRTARCHDTGPHIGDLLVELADEKTVRGLAPDLPGPRPPTPSAASSPPPRAEDPAAGYDFVSRCFFPRRRHRRGPGHRQRPHRPRPLLVRTPGPHGPDRPAGLRPLGPASAPNCAATAPC